MFLGKVVGSLWSTIKCEELTGTKFLLVRPYTLSEAGKGKMSGRCRDAVVAADVFDAGIGDDVVVAYGHAARVGMEQSEEGEVTSTPVDASVVAVVDQFNVEKKLLGK